MTRANLQSPDPRLDLVFERVVDVPRELVWTAWTRPAVCADTGPASTVWSVGAGVGCGAVWAQAAGARVPSRLIRV